VSFEVRAAYAASHVDMAAVTQCNRMLFSSAIDDILLRRTRLSYARRSGMHDIEWSLCVASSDNVDSGEVVHHGIKNQ